MSSRNNVSLRVDVQMALTCILLVLCFLQFCAGQDLQTQFLSPHNDARSQVGVGQLVWDDTVAAYAQNYANQRMADCALQHSGGQYGENIFEGSGVEYTPADAVNLWVSENQYYDYDSNTCAGGQQCGHYTQVVWANSQKLGCARVKCNNGGIFITCNYDPPGNYVGQRPYGSTSTSVEPPRSQFLSPHNEARSEVGVGPLVWDDTVAAYAQNYANQRMADCALQHSGGQYGENIFWGSGAEFTPADAVNSWVNEKQYYNYDSNTCAQRQECRHYTQVVWKNTQKLGCARVKCDSHAIFITCNYDPPGNYVGQRPYGPTSTSVELRSTSVVLF